MGKMVNHILFCRKEQILFLYKWTLIEKGDSNENVRVDSFENVPKPFK